MNKSNLDKCSLMRTWQTHTHTHTANKATEHDDENNKNNSNTDRVLFFQNTQKHTNKKKTLTNKPIEH